MEYFFCLLQTACQQGDDDDIDDSDQQAEFDAMLIEYAGDVLPSLATAVGGQIFAPYFAGFLPLLLKKTVSKPVFQYKSIFVILSILL